MSIDETAGFVTRTNAVPGTTAQVGGSGLFWGFKRLFDFAVSVALLPLFALLAVVLLIANPFLNRGSLFFTQRRMGRGCQPFTTIKFRSMLPVGEIARTAEDPIELDRITPLGEILRKTRIDELPQILNVLRGDMSLIGPRPDYYEHACEFLSVIPEYRARHAVRPGISGLAQVTLGYAEGIEATRLKARADLAYIHNASIGMENRIVLLTIVTILTRRGV